MLYRNKREYEQSLKNLENALHDGAQKAKRETRPQPLPADGSE